MTSHNVFVEIPKSEDEVDGTKVMLDGLELFDFEKYANMFFNYRNVSVWAAPEVLKQPKKVQEPTFAMDVYSFGLILWEIYHEMVPFDGDLKACTDYVTGGEDQRPAISTLEVDEEQHSSGDEEEKAPERTRDALCSGPIAALIRQCWESDPAERPSFTNILE